MESIGQWLNNFIATLPSLKDVFTTINFWLGILVCAVLVGIWQLVVRKRYQAKSVALNLPFGLGNITYEATERDRALAWKMYVQLKTRKAALPFDEDHDVIINIFDSLYEMFSVTRELLSDASPHQGEAQKSVADLLLRVLNDGIRPYLTRWHASYRVWWDNANELPENKEKSPQEIQRTFQNYMDLTLELKNMNDELIKYAEELLAIVYAGQRWHKSKKQIEITPEQPLQQTSSALQQNISLSSVQNIERCELPIKKEKP